MYIDSNLIFLGIKKYPYISRDIGERLLNSECAQYDIPGCHQQEAEIFIICHSREIGNPEGARLWRRQVLSPLGGES